MKHEVARYVSECDTCRKLKVDYMKPEVLLQQLCIIEWRWEEISMDFIVGSPMTAHKFDSIWVIIDRLSKSAHFIPINSKDNNLRPSSHFVAHFWEQLHMSLGTRLIHSSAYHPQTDGQTE
jgi:hypothetical protein